MGITMGIIDYQLRHRKTRNKESLKTETRRTIKMLIATLGIMLITLAIVFLATTSESAQKGYLLQQLKLQNEELKSEKNSLSRKITDSTAFSNLENNGKIEKMEKSTSKSFVTEEDNMVK